MKKSHFLIFIVTLFSLQIFARDWQKIKIPGAKCGDGADYSIFLDQKDQTKVMFELMGGGACWSFSTCYGPNVRTWIYPIPELPAFSRLTLEKSGSHPFTNHTVVYFPYCTGDVHSGNHIAEYLPGIKTYHTGYKNFQLALAYLNEKKLIKFSQIQDFVMWGASAGAIGSLVHSKNVEAYLPESSHKTLIADSPGLHFGKTFWNKFTPETVGDFQTAFAKVGLFFDPHDGMIAPYMGPVFDQLSSWNIGILQSTKDIIMSSVFGDLSPDEHERNVLGAHGLPEIAKGYGNVNVWIPRSRMHTFLLINTDTIRGEEKILSQNALEFIKQIHAKR